MGEALVSTLDGEGAPSVVQRTLVAPPRSRLGPVSDKERAVIQSVSPFAGKYDTRVNRESAEEVLAAKAADAAATGAEVADKGREEVGKRERISPGLWDGIGGKVAKAAAGAAAASAGSILAQTIQGKTSRASPQASAASAAAGAIGDTLGRAVGFPGLGRFARNLIGGLMR